MKNKIIKHNSLLFLIGILLPLLSACNSGATPDNWGNKNNPFGGQENSNGNNGGNAGEKSNNNGNNNNQGSKGDNGESSGDNNEVTFDENSTKFSHSFSGTGAGEVAIQVNSDNCKDDELVIPSTYVDSKGIKYKVTMDYGNGFGYLSAQKITLPDGFKEIHEGFDMCMYVKRIYLPKTITKLYNEILTSCISLKTIDFAGTKAQWNAIEKEERWNFNAPAFDVSCSDGIINIEKGPTA